jgi:serine/threonine protein kinase
MKEMLVELSRVKGDENRKSNVSEWVIDLKEYESVGSIGENARVQLWKCQNHGEEVAVKSYPKCHTAEQEFIREIEALIILNHPCILNMKGYCLPTRNEGAKLVSEYLCKGSLKPILGSGVNFPEWWTIKCRTNCVVGLVVGMKYVHNRNIIHRDLKPENILLDDDLHIRIGDFGFSRVFEEGITMTDAGTLLYTAPEVADSHYDKKIDVYSFGLILYEIMSCDKRFSAPEVSGKLRLYLNLQNGWRPEIPSGITALSRSLIERCWSANALDRPSFEEIWIELSENGFQLIEGSDRADVNSYLSYLARHGATIERDNG